MEMHQLIDLFEYESAKGDLMKEHAFRRQILQNFVIKMLLEGIAFKVDKVFFLETDKVY